MFSITRVVFLLGAVICIFRAKDHPSIPLWIAGGIFLIVVNLMGMYTATDYRSVLISLSQMIGLLCNGLVIVANAGYMPVLNAFAKFENYGCWRLAKESDRFLFLCDRFPMLIGIFSIGDFFLVGALLFHFLPKR